jgi:hypothetical protein
MYHVVTQRHEAAGLEPQELAMNENASSTATETTKRTCDTLLQTITELGTTWAAYGLQVGKMALQQSAHTLGKTAEALDLIASELQKKAAPPAPEAAPAPAAPAADAPKAADA